MADDATDKKPLLRAVPPAPPAGDLSELASQLSRSTIVNRMLRERVQTERMALKHEHQRKWMEAEQFYAQKLHDATITIQNERDAVMRQLEDSFQTKSQEIDKLAAQVLDMG